jgi:hypothetical protein
MWYPKMKRSDHHCWQIMQKASIGKKTRTEHIKDEEAIIKSKGRHQHFIRTTIKW